MVNQIIISSTDNARRTIFTWFLIICGQSKVMSSAHCTKMVKLASDWRQQRTQMLSIRVYVIINHSLLRHVRQHISKKYKYTIKTHKNTEV